MTDEGTTDEGQRPPAGSAGAARSDATPSPPERFHATAAGPSSFGPASIAYAPAYLHVAWAVAALGVLSALAGRAISPALAGVWVGVDRVITTVELGSALLAQLFAVLAVSLTVTLAVAVSRSAWPTGYRAFAVAVVGLITMAVTSAMFIPLPDVSGIAAGGAASVLALLVAGHSAPIPECRAASVALGGVGLGGLLRMFGVGIASLGQEDLSVVMQQIAQVAATAGFVAHAIVVLIVLGWLSWHKGRPWLLLVGLILLGLSGAIVAVGVAGGRVEASGLSVLTGRALGMMLNAPAPLVPPVVQAALAVVAWLLAVAALFKRWPVPMMPVAVCLALVGLAEVEAPLCALALVLASLMVAVGPQPTVVAPPRR